MSWVTVVWSMVASACLTLAAIYTLVWWKNRSEWSRLLFAVTAVSTTGVALTELARMRATTPAEFVAGMQWSQLALGCLFVSITWFVWTYLRAGRLWLAWTVTGLRVSYLLFTFLAGITIPFSEVTSLRQMDFLGESITVFGGVSNPLTRFGHFTLLLMLTFVVDASLTAWRRGDRRKARMVGGSVVFFILAGLATSSIVIYANIPVPIVVSQCYLGLVMVMAYELGRDVLRSSELVTELQASEAQLRESEERLSLAIDTAESGLWIRDLRRNEIWASDTWRSLFGFAPSEPLVFADVMQRLHPDDRHALVQTPARALSNGSGGRYQTEYRLILPGGVTRWILSLDRVEVDGSGQAVLIRGVSREITARKQAEQETQTLREAIAHAGRVSMMGQLASALAHEINQPLATILRNAEAAELFLQDDSPDLDEVRAILADIRQDDARAGEVIDRMGNLLRRHTLETRRLSVAPLVADVVALLRVDARTRHVTLEVDVPADLPDVRGDRVHLQQVLLNLIINGMDALSGTNPEDRRVRVTAGHDGAHTLRIAVTDAGPGIPADILAEIFNPFFTTKPNGMGMGLAISRTIIEAHGGRLWAENTNGRGAVVSFSVPIAEAAAGS